MKEELKTWFSVSEIAQFLGVSKETIYSMTTSKKMPHHKIGRLLKFNRDEINKWVLNQTKSKTVEGNSNHG